MRIVIATHNSHKAVEIGAMLSPLGFTIAPMPKMSLPAEEAETFAAIASAKALAVARATGLYTLGDDSGLCVDALDGAPGTRSARYAGSPTSDRANNDKLLAALAGTKRDNRTAHFVCALVLAGPDGTVEVAEGRVTGVILPTPRGNGGFGYDPLFLIPEVDKTMAELSPMQKSSLSHRGRAVRLMIPILQRVAAAISAK